VNDYVAYLLTRRAAWKARAGRGVHTGYAGRDALLGGVRD